MFYIREWLRQIRQKENISQKGVAEQVSITQQYYNYIENGERRPAPPKAKKIAKALNFSKHGYDWTKFYEDEI